MNINELRDERGHLLTEAREIVNTAEAENRDLTSDEEEAYNYNLRSAATWPGKYSD